MHEMAFLRLVPSWNKIVYCLIVKLLQTEAYTFNPTGMWHKYSITVYGKNGISKNTFALTKIKCF